jgi:serine/threonine protein kinase
MANQCLPFFESAYLKDIKYRYICESRSGRYWEKIENSKHISDELKDLIIWLLLPVPELRPTIAEIKLHPWLAGNTPTDEEIRVSMREKLRISNLGRKSKGEKPIPSYSSSSFESSMIKRSSEKAEEDGKIIERKELEYDPDFTVYSKFFSTSELKTLWYLCAEFMKIMCNSDFDVEEDRYSMTGTKIVTIKRMVII